MKIFRKRFGMKAVVGCVGLWALLFWAMRFSRDSRPEYLYGDWLRTGDDSRRLEAAGELGSVGPEGAVAVPALIRAMLCDTAAPIRKRSAESLASVVSTLNDTETTAAAARAFVRALDDTEASVREASAKGLGQIGPDPEEVVPALLEAANEENEWVRGAAVAALGLVQKRAGVDRTDVRRDQENAL